MDRSCNSKASEEGGYHRLIGCVWRPFHAKAVWSVVGLYWSGLASSMVIPQLASVYDNAFAGVLFAVLFPPLVLLALSIPFIRACLDNAEVQEEGGDDWERSRNPFFGPWGPVSMGGARNDPFLDPADPRSGRRWVGRRWH